MKRGKIKISGAAISVYASSRLGKGGGGLYDRACQALEIDGMPMPMDATQKSWVRSKLDFIYEEVQKSHPQNFKKLVVPNVLSVRITQIKKKPAVFNQSDLFIISNDFLFSFEWRKLRMQAIKLHGARCMCCGATPATGAVINVDHVKPRKKYPQLALEITNLQILCHVCNHGKGNWDETDWRKS